MLVIMEGRLTVRKAVACIAILLLASLALVLGFYVLPMIRGETIRVPEDYERIQWAIGNVSDGDIIIVNEGYYVEGQIDIYKSGLTLKANGTVVVDGLQEGHVFHITGNRTRIQCFTVMNASRERTPVVYDRDHNWWTGIYLNGTQGCVVYNNTITKNYRAVELWHSVHNDIIGNYIVGNDEGVTIFRSYSRNDLFDNVLVNNRIGFDLDGCNHSRFINNMFAISDFSIGGATGFDIGVYSYHNEIMNNTIRNCLEPITTYWNALERNKVENNTIIDNVHGN